MIGLAAIAISKRGYPEVGDMLNLMFESAAFILVLFVLVPFFLFSYWLYHVSGRRHGGDWHEDDTAGSARH